MSLDVYLTVKGAGVGGTGIFIREDGQNRELTRAEWDEKFPGREPLVVQGDEGDDVYWSNITHNLNQMADSAGLYQALWRPEELNITRADQLVEPLRAGLEKLRANPAQFRQFNPSNGWGKYENLVSFVEEYLAACEKYPHAEVRASR